MPALSVALDSMLSAVTAVTVVVSTGCSSLAGDTLLNTNKLVSMRSLPVSFGIPCELASRISLFASTAANRALWQGLSGHTPLSPYMTLPFAVWTL
jgi:hypothetical protein